MPIAWKTSSAMTAIFLLLFLKDLSHQVEDSHGETPPPLVLQRLPHQIYKSDLTSGSSTSAERPCLRG
jgi:hypothetical protein